MWPRFPLFAGLVGCVVMASACSGRRADPEPAPASPNASPKRLRAKAPSAPGPTEASPEPSTPPEAPTPPPRTAPTPEPMATALDAALSPLHPEAVVVMTRRRHRAEEVVLYRIRPAQIWRAERERAGDLEATLEREEEAERACDEDETLSTDSADDCRVRAHANPYLGWESLHAEEGVWDFAVARIQTRGDEVQVLARRTLYRLGIPVGPPVEASPQSPEIRVRNLDGDEPPEITIMFNLEVPDADSFVHVEGRYAAIVDWVDLHSQFETARELNEESGDVDARSVVATTTWFSQDLNGDGASDLRVRRRVEVSDAEGDTSDVQVLECPWTASDDRFTCPQSLSELPTVFETPNAHSGATTD